jgi:hypothetical protein
LSGAIFIDKKNKMPGDHQMPFPLKMKKTKYMQWWPPNVPPFDYEEKKNLMATKYF